MKIRLMHAFLLTMLVSAGHATQRIEEFRVVKGQTVSKAFESLTNAYETDVSLQILVAPDIAEKKLKESVFRNMTIDLCIRFIAAKNELFYIRKGNLFVITGSRESIENVHKEIHDAELPPQRKLGDPKEKKEISNMPVFGERPEFDMVWKMKKELEQLRNRVATLEKKGASQAR